ncbi:MAG: GHKL domain-containing protein [Oscillospiraceae bacterium]|nr:GHKL domain-containing protein [Oscillospiraceae bacterium]
MQLLNFTLAGWLFYWGWAILYFILAKILSHNWKLRGKECVCILLFSLLFTVAAQALRWLEVPLGGTILNFVFLFSIFFYLYSIQAESFQMSFTLAVFSLIVALPTERVVLYTIRHFVPAFPDVREFLPSAIFFLSIYTSSILITFLLTKTFWNSFVSITQNKRLQSTLTLIVAFLFFSFQTIVALQEYLGVPLTLLSWSSAFIFTYVMASLVSFLLYTRVQKVQSTLREKEIEHSALLYYMDESEHQQIAMRKFKHDYQNILISMDSFLEEDDLPGLKQYYATRIKIASEIITQSDFALEGLNKIKVREIKGILAAKLTMAQHLGLDAKFEAVEEIDHIPVNSVALVRILGIILDNAIEELESLGEGQLIVACYKDGTGVTFVVLNTCRSDMQPLHELEQVRFSTKGEDRGWGLHNLAELVAAHSDTLTLQTSIADGNFIQKLWIGGSE